MFFLHSDIFKHSVQQVDNTIFKYQDVVQTCLSQYKSVSGKEWVCLTCVRALQSGKIPACSVANCLSFPEVPEELKLSQMEERLVAPRLAFMQLRELPRGGQLSLRGNVVNVPADVNTTVKVLPRMQCEEDTIFFKFKRKKSYKHHVAFEKIRPNKVLCGAKWLVQNNVLYRNEGIKVDDNWLNRYQGNLNQTECSEVTEQNHCEDSFSQSDSDVWTEDENFDNRPTGNCDTLLHPADFREFNKILSVAPGEGNSPLGLFQDIYSEFLAFPSIYCGQSRPDNSCRPVPLHYSTICKWELRNIDRRVAMNIPNIFYKLKKIQIKQIKDKVSLAIRKCKTKGKRITARDVLSPGFVDDIAVHSEGFRVLRKIRGSPPYWESTKKDVFAMIRQLGVPTWFCSFSAAETRWAPLLKCLCKLVQKRDLTDDEVALLNWKEKSDLIKSDPVTCARYFDYRIQCFLNTVLKNDSHPVGEIIDYFGRIEFQQRGSPHIHLLIWVKEAPMYGQSSKSDLEIFLDKYITCRKDATMPELVNYQTHRHARTCRKKGKAICRFNFPIPPMPSTVILEPLVNDGDKAVAERDYLKIATFLNELNTKEFESFSDFLKELDMDFETYIQAVRSSLSSTKVFLQRSPSETRINSYNTILLKCWEANMDIQFVLDPYACVSYIVSYISKGQRGLSNLLYQACKEAKAKDSDIRQQVRRVGNQFLSHVEVGAQEAVYLVLQMPLRKSTRTVVFIDTNTPEERVVLLKSFTDLKELPENSTNIESDNDLKRYRRRPLKLENCTYADFVSWYDRLYGSRKGHAQGCIQSCDSELPEENDNFDNDDTLHENNEENKNETNSIIEFVDGTLMKRRNKQKVLRYQMVSENENKEKHYRQLLMLFTSWRNEEVDLLNGYDTYFESYLQQKNAVLFNQKQYEKVEQQVIDNAMQGAEASEDILYPVLPEVDHQELIDSTEGLTASNSFACFDPSFRGDNSGAPSEQACSYDIGQDLGVSRKQLDDDFTLPLNEMNDDDYRKHVQSLNLKQKEFFYHVLHWLKTKEEPIYAFLSGGAGVGKSVVTSALYQALLKYYNHQPGNNPDHLKILLCAPTGKAAHNIKGKTIHSTFAIPVGRGFKFKPLDMQQLDTMRCKYHDVRVVFIDEISMVGNGMFNFINLRLQEIRGCTKPFGGVSVVAVGDLFQLKPVMDSWIFSPKPNGLEVLGTNLWQSLFSFYELEEIMRQKGDLQFAQLLNRLREGKHIIPDDIDTLKTRVLAEEPLPETVENLPHLYTTRDKCARHNSKIIATVPDSLKTNVEAIDCVSGEISKELTKRILEKIPDDTSKTMGLKTNLLVGVGVTYELCVNIDVDDGLTNGSPCIVKKIDYRVENSHRCSIIWAAFEEQSVGEIWRQKYAHLYQNNIPRDWTPILETTRSFTLQHYKTYYVTRRQFPIQIAAGKTIHKAQGSTLKRGAVLDFGNRKIEHIHYVGLSRVQNLESANVLNLNENKICVSDAVKEEMVRLRTDCQIELSIPNVELFGTATNSVTICFHNCRSLKKHIDDIRKDCFLMKADVIGFCETRVTDQEHLYEIDGYESFHAQSDAFHGMVL